ncbi:MAG: hypothetical protein PWP21_195 [Thermosediminibacterales bacterium]|nr:hypothetical protein [Thermosediminibacterales bacterium]
MFVIFNVRYYIVTMTAIFLALGIGMFSGVMLNNNKILEKSQDKIIESLEKKFNDLKKEKYNLLTELKKIRKSQQVYNEILEKVFPDIISNRLDGLNILMIQTHLGDLGLNLIDDLTNAGARVQSVSIGNIKKSIPEVLNDYPVLANSDRNNENYFLDKVIEGLLRQEDNSLIEFLKDRKVINVVGDYPGSFDYVVIVDERKNKQEEMELVIAAVIQSLKRNHKNVIAVETKDTENVFINLYKQQKIPTIDNIDTVLGKLALIFGMEKGINGHYGVKNGAEELFPLEVIK